MLSIAPTGYHSISPKAYIFLPPQPSWRLTRLSLMVSLSPSLPFSMWINEVLPHRMSNGLTEDTKTHWLLDGCQGTSTYSVSPQHQRDGRWGECTCRFHRTYVSDDRRLLILTCHLCCAAVKTLLKLMQHTFCVDVSKKRPFLAKTQWNTLQIICRHWIVNPT